MASHCVAARIGRQPCVAQMGSSPVSLQIMQDSDEQQRGETQDVTANMARSPNPNFQNST